MEGGARERNGAPSGGARRRTGGRRAAPLPLLAVGLWALAACAATRPAEEVLEDTGAASPVTTSPEAAATESTATGSPAEVSPAAVSQATGASEGAEDVAAPTRAELRASAALELERSRLECAALLDRARAADASYEVLMAASRALVLNADLRLQSTLAFGPDEAALPAPRLLIDLEDEATPELKAEIRSLASTSAALADRALALRPDDPTAELFSTLGTGLRLWSMPTLQALASGAATTLPGRIKALAATSADLEGASPLRLKGRFQTRAPWPFKDLEDGAATLAAAVEVAPIPLNLLFLGDALWLRGDEEGARARWTEATRAEADAETMAAAPLIREIARLRLVSAGAPTAP